MGMSYLGEVRWNHLPDSLVNAEVVVEIMSGDGTSGKVIHLVLTSGNRAPYRWEYTYWNNGNSLSGWIGFQPQLTAGSNITISGNTISATDTTYTTATYNDLGLVKLGSATQSSQTIETASSTTGRQYPVQVDTNSRASVNVPWTDTTYTAGANITIQNNIISANTGLNGIAYREI